MVRNGFKSVAIALLLSNAVGCSSFNKSWNVAGNMPEGNSLAGRWEGSWVSSVNGHHGRLQCAVIPREDSFYDAHFRAKYWKILTFSYTVQLQASKVQDHYQFEGKADLGWWAGGRYNYNGVANASVFTATYTNRFDHGRFNLNKVP